MAKHAKAELDERIAEFYDRYRIFKELAERAKDPTEKQEYLASAERQKTYARELVHGQARQT